VPTVFLGEMVPVETTLAAERRLQPSVVVLWALRQDNTARTLARRLHARHVPLILAGAGWQGFTAVPAKTTDDLEHALGLVEALIPDRHAGSGDSDRY
jgi:hypothetical protein